MGQQCPFCLTGFYVRDVKIKASRLLQLLLVLLAVSVPNVDGRKHGRRLIWLLSAGWYRMTKVRRGASSV
jgi:hypothetical protein